jgi:hypothetical protein
VGPPPRFSFGRNRPKLLRLSRGLFGLGRMDSRRTNHESLDGRGQALTKPSVDSFRAVVSERRTGRSDAGQPQRRRVSTEPGPPLGDLGPGKKLEDLPSDVALQDPDDLTLGAALLGAALHVLAGARVERKTGHDDSPQRLVGVAVATTVKAMAGDLARGCFDGGHAAKMGPGGLRVEALRIVASSRRGVAATWWTAYVLINPFWSTWTTCFTPAT